MNTASRLDLVIKTSRSRVQGVGHREKERARESRKGKRGNKRGE